MKSLLIVGAGKIAYYLLGILKDSRIDTKVIEINPERAVSSVKSSQISILSKEMELQKTFYWRKVLNYDAVATLTGVDEENIITLCFLTVLRCP